jgi:hypothetical protein
MLEYKVSGPLNDVIYKRYNKRYVTPPIFEYYNFKPILCICGIASSLILLLLREFYQYVLFVDVGLALAYVITTLIVRLMYQNGIINKSVYTHTKAFKFARFVATNVQMAFWRILLPGCVILFNEFDFETIEFVVCGCIGLLMCVASIFSVSGIGCRQRFYTKTAQSAYNAILEGPKSLNEESTVLVTHSLDFKITELLHPDVATAEFFRAQEKFFNTANEIKNILDNYDNEWRKAIVYGNYSCRKTIGTTPMAKRLMDLMEEHKANAEVLNSVIVKLNSMEYHPPKRVEPKTVFAKPKPKAVPVQQPKKTNDFWGNVANWYD